jgi:hypothetical protein
LADSLFPFSVQQPQTPLFGSRELVVIPISATGVNEQLEQYEKSSHREKTR